MNMMGSGEKVVLAYSGGLDTSVIVKWLTRRNWRVIAFMADVGQSENLAPLVKRAKGAGAHDVVVKDLREEFVREYVWPALQAHAVYEGEYLLATSLSRPIIAKHMVDVAHKMGAKAIAHGCTGKGNDQVRFEVTARIFDPSLKILAPVRVWEFRSREEEIDYAKRHKIPVDVTKKSPYSIDQNLWGTSIEAGVMEDPWVEPPADTFRSIVAPEKAPNRAAYVEVSFQRGVPVKVNGASLKPVALIERLHKLGAAHGIGRTDMIESRVVGIKSREVYEAPAGTILLAAHQELERLVLDRRLLQAKQGISATYAELVYSGLWFTPLKRALDVFVKETQKRVTGTVRLKLYKGKCQVVGRKSPYALYKEKLATYTSKDAFDQSHSEGFIKLFGLSYEGSG
jgi:argininosuccinate synthase